MNDISQTIGYADWSWNPVTGCLGPGGTVSKPAWCSYCYARRIAERFRGSKAWPQGFDPLFHPERLFDPMRKRKPSKIFVCDMADLFGDWVPREWINDIIGVARCAERHTFLFLTKNPARLREFNPWPDNCFVGVSATNNLQFEVAVKYLKEVEAKVKFISFEPLLGPITDSLEGLQWVILGGLSGLGGRVSYPKPAWVAAIEAAVHSAGIPVFEKNNLAKLLGPDLRQEYPKV